MLRCKTGGNHAVAVNTCCSSTRRSSGPDRWPLCSTPLHICSSLLSCDCSLRIKHCVIHRVKNIKNDCDLKDIEEKARISKEMDATTTCSKS